MSARRLLVPVTWLCATIAAVGLAWIAVSSAVHEVTGPMPAVVAATQRGVARGEPTAATVDTTSTAPAPAEDPAAASPDPSGGGAAPSPSPPPHAGAVDPGAAVGDSFQVDHESTASATTAPPTTQSFNTNGGVVTMSCNGDAASLVSATPNQGYTVAVDNPGPDGIEVTFRSSSDDETFHGQCVAGRPTTALDD